MLKRKSFLLYSVIFIRKRTKTWYEKYLIFNLNNNLTFPKFTFDIS